MKRLGIWFTSIVKLGWDWKRPRRDVAAGGFEGIQQEIYRNWGSKKAEFGHSEFKNRTALPETEITVDELPPEQ